MNALRIPELLAPAGNRERLDAALHFGADAVYGGGKRFGLRAYADNFDIEELTAAVQACHQQGKRFYYTLNAYLQQADLPALRTHLQELEQTGVDALIISDPGVLMTVREAGCALELHLSTQANALNAAAARFWAQAGVQRLVLARECTLTDIRHIRDALPPEVELECFVHGAMCIAYSGRCLLSNMLDGRDGNRGACSQVCRRRFELREHGDNGLYYPIEEGEHGTYVFNSRDMNLIADLATLCEAGIDSFKIEGRMKTAYYVATVVNAYRMALDGLAAGQPWNPAIGEELLKIRHRPYSTGFYFADSRPQEQRETQNENANIQTHEFVGVVQGYDAQQGALLVEQRNRFYPGDELEVISPGRLGQHLLVARMTDHDGNPLQSARHPQQQVYLYADAGKDCHPGDLLRRRMEQPLR